MLHLEWNGNVYKLTVGEYDAGVGRSPVRLRVTRMEQKRRSIRCKRCAEKEEPTMNYVNDRFCELVQLPRNRQAILAMKKDVDDFLPSFCDSPAKLSRWGHHYFCDDDGGRLIFDLNSPHSHRCEICGKVYSNDVQDGVWVTFYRNRAVVLALVSAAVYKATGETKYRDYALQVIDFYAAHYHEFVLHNKENKIFDSYETMKWGCGMMPQGLNEAIVAIRFIQTIEILRPELEQEWLENVHRKLFREMFRLLAPQAVEIHNISCWSLAAIGVMGLAMKDQEMIDYAFTSPFYTGVSWPRV